MIINWEFVRQVAPLEWVARNSVLQFRKRILKRDTKMCLPIGARITLPRQSLTSTEIYVDWGAEAIFARFADKNRDFLDIGSHIGYYAAYLAPCVRRVYAFEPDKRNILGLQVNACSVKNIEVVEMAVSSRSGVGKFFRGCSSSVASLNGTKGPTETGALTTIDTFVANHPGIDVGLIKTDIEKHDLEALRGMESTVARFQPLILTECDLSGELLELCAGWKYKLFGIVRNRRTQRTEFRQLGSDASPSWYKMLFLVPQALQSAFGALTQNFSHK